MWISLQYFDIKQSGEHQNAFYCFDCDDSEDQ